MEDLRLVVPGAIIYLILIWWGLKTLLSKIATESNDYYKQVISTMREVPISEIDFDEKGMATGGYEFYLNQYKNGRPSRGCK